MPKQYHCFTFVFRPIFLNMPFSMSLLKIIDIFYLAGKPMLPDVCFVATDKAAALRPQWSLCYILI